MVLMDGEVEEKLVLERAEEPVVSGIGLEIDLPGRSGGVGWRRRTRMQSPAGPWQCKKLR
jgi:hypothetical protein